MTEEITNDSKMVFAYDKNARISIPSYDALFTMIQSYYRAQLGEKEATVLIVGAGGGNEITAWGPTNPKWLFTGVDPSEDMLKIAEHKAVQLNLMSRVTLIHGPIDRLPPADSKFDAASCILVLHFIDDVQEKLKLLGTIKNNLKQGAPFVLVSACGDRDSTELHHQLNVWKSFWLDGGRDWSQVDEMVKKILSTLSFLPEQQIEQLLAEAGFNTITRFYTTGIFSGWICHAE
ncbi:tRNA (cmo5U34)-methyltransferase [Paenibacillus endophyticus]|uniref:tRNA (Cmo5U34)-methyltransferase n=1 Tax=Paenibacillus endophyticus TaxID=1294268 RepID=A0A7W5C9T9_9BACL|nr:class I SAM-dependent methyltransferase [Paenibacillus endophyticus]MBB3153782.1 tRNA (cmo5U34)-methyltransferase [Paenibacillus endophyticus]